jgi:nicotinate-nucleotide adenylyltransferase
MRVAFFGGTFDPIHRGHTAIAQAAAEQFGLGEIVFAPVGRQPLKAKTAEAPFADRLAMVRLACETGALRAKLVASDIDAPKSDGEPNYTADTLAELALTRRDAELFAISGADSFLTLRSWREPDRLLELAQWIVVSRPGFPLSREALGALGLTEAQLARIHLLATVHENVSASELRRRLRAGEDCRDWVAEPVMRYIRERGLYGFRAGA